MNRNLKQLANQRFDLLVIGGGITGACSAWDAALRGLSVALIEKSDFGAATSAASGKVIHGGIRYLQYGDIRRLRESLHERMVFQRIAPHLVKPIPFLIPTYGHFTKGKPFLKAGMSIYDLLGLDKRKTGDPSRAIPAHKSLSRKAVLEAEPGIDPKGLTGGLVYYDCQMHNPERLTLSFIESAYEKGACIANHLKASKLLYRNGRVEGACVEDAFSQESFDIRAAITINAAGPWANNIIGTHKALLKPLAYRFSKGIHLVAPSITNKYAIALTSRDSNSGSLVKRGGRHFFVIPWRGYSILGTSNSDYGGGPDGKMVHQGDIDELLNHINGCYPGSHLTAEDVCFQYGGLYLDDSEKAFNQGYQGARKDTIIDHAETDGVDGFISSLAVKYTLARRLAQKTIDLVLKKMDKKPPQCTTETTPLAGGTMSNFGVYLKREVQKHPHTDVKIIENLISNHGDRYGSLVDTGNKESQEILRLNHPFIKSQIHHAVRHEMAQTMADVVFNRTGIGTIGHPGKACLKMILEIMSDELNWGRQRSKSEYEQVIERFHVPSPQTPKN